MPAIKLRFPKTTLATVECIHTRLDQWLKKGFQQLRCGCETRREVLLLPLRPAQQNWEIRTHFCPASLNNFDDKTASGLH
jgi:hypothetical protein